MPTENPKPAPGPEIKLSAIPNRSGATSTLPPSMLDAINAEASKNGPAEGKTDEPPSDATPADKTPPAQQQSGISTKSDVKAVQPPPAEPAPKKKEGIESVREALERAEKRAKDASDSLTATAKEKADAFAKVAELEGKLAKYADEIEKDYKPRVAKLEEAEKEIQRTREILKIKAYQETPEFHNTYVKPLVQTREDISAFISEIEVPTEDGKSRRATMEDFNAVLSAPSHTAARAIAKQIFGEDDSTILNFRLKLQSQNRSREQAVKDAALNAEEWEKRNREQMTENQRAVRERILSEAKRLIETDANVAVPEGDEELKSSLHEGQKLADQLLNGDPNVSQEDFLGLIGKGRASIIKYPLLEKKFAKLQKEHDELKEQLKQYQLSEPDVRGRSGGAARPANGNSGDLRGKLLEAANAAAVQR